VLKSMGRLEAAAASYRAIRAEFPYDPFSRSGLATVLLMLGDYDGALALLPDSLPEVRQDWVAWHIRGMVLLRSGRTNEALRVFRHGLKNGAPSQEPYFRVGIAVASCWGQRWSEAKDHLLAVKLPPPLARFSNIVWLHIHAANRDHAGVGEALTQLTSGHPPAVVVDLAMELRRRYQGERRGTQPDAWVRQREVDCLVLAA
jgi:tetratricopeptide (TPR) repeat protein